MNMSKNSESCVFVRKKDLADLATEITQLKCTLPKVLTKNLTAQSRIQTLEEEKEKLQEQCHQLMSQSQHWRSRCETAITDTQTEKQECLKLRCDMQDLTQQLTQQSDYCSSLGSACCTLLWRVSRQEDSIQAILGGTKVDEFLSLVSSTLRSYLAAYKTDWPQELNDEMQFVLALCGVITNIAASAYGREFLCSNSNGKLIVDTYIEVLSEAPSGKSSRMKNLLLMSLYNLSINQKGLKYLEGKTGLISLCAWLLQGETDSELRVNCLRLIQSLLYDVNNVNALHEVQEVLPGPVLEQLSKDMNSDVRTLSLELINDLRTVQIPSEM